MGEEFQDICSSHDIYGAGFRERLSSVLSLHFGYLIIPLPQKLNRSEQYPGTSNGWHYRP